MSKKGFNISKAASKTVSSVINNATNIENYIKSKNNTQFIQLDINSVILNDENELIYGKVEDSSDYEILYSSIKEKGVLEPILVNYIDSKYYLFSGHRRLYISKKLNFDTIPTIVFNQDTNFDEDDIQAVLIHSNIQREKDDFIKSEELNRLKKYYSKQRELFPEKFEGINTVDILSEMINASVTTTKRLLSLNKLIPELKEMADKEVPLSTLQIFTVLNEDSQKEIYLQLLKNPNITFSEANDIKNSFKEKEKLMGKGNSEVEIESLKAKNQIKKISNNLNKTVKNIEKLPINQKLKDNVEFEKLKNEIIEKIKILEQFIVKE